MRVKVLAIVSLTLICLSSIMIPRLSEPGAPFTIGPDGSKNYERGAGLDVKLSVSVSTEVTTVAPPPSVTLPLFNWSDIIALLSLAGNPFIVWVWRKWSNRKPIPGVVARPPTM